MRTSFVGGSNPFTGKSTIKVVPKPEVTPKVKGTTKYDDKFEQLIDGTQAILVESSEFQAVRKALQRFIEMRGLNMTVRQSRSKKTQINHLYLESKSS